MADEKQTLTAADIGTVDTPVSSKAPLTEKLRQDLLAEKAKLEAALQPYRDAYEKMVNDPRLLEAKKAIREISAHLGRVNNELSRLLPIGKRIIAEPGKYNSK